MESSIENKPNIANKVLQGIVSSDGNLNASSSVSSMSLSEIPSNIQFKTCKHVTVNINVNKN